MLQPITRRDAYEPSATVVINGEPVDVASVKVERALPDPLSRGELRSAEAQIVAVDGPDVTDTIATPWDPASQWPPAKESPASVSFDTGAGTVPSLTDGRVVHSGGGTDDRPVDVEVLDQYQTLDKTISWGPMADAMPSPQEAVPARYVALQSVAVTDMILRHCGWYSTPPPIDWSLLSVPAQGTMWPETGTLDASASSTNGYPGFLGSPWGVGVSDTDSTYFLAGGGYTIKQRGVLELSAMTATRPGQGSSRIDVLTLAGSGLLARLTWTETTAFVMLQNSSGSLVSALSMPRVDGLLYATVEYVSDTSVAVSLTSGASTVTGTATVHADVTTGTIGRGRIVSAAVSSGFQIAMPATTGALAGWTPNAVLYPRSSGRNTMFALPPVESANCAELLAEQCAAECATYWIDELGILRWWDLARLEAQPVVANINSSDDITRAGFRWSNDPSTVKSRVSVKWKQPLRDWSWRTTVDLWQGSGASIQQNTATVTDPTQSWVNVPDNEVWISPDLSLLRAGDAGSIEDFNLGFGSFYGGVISGRGTDPDVWVQNTPGSLIMTVEKVTDTAFKLSTVWTGSETAVQKTAGPESSSSLWYRRRDFDLPIIRGKAKFTFTDLVTYSAQVGPRTAPEHAIDAGFWLQRPEQAQYTADYAGARMTIQQPTVTELPIVMIPGLQVGDMVEATESAVSRLTIRGLVIRDSRRIAAGVDMGHSIAIRPTHVARNGITWEEWGAVMDGRTWQTWGGQQNGKTWQDWGNDPLAGEE